MEKFSNTYYRNILHEHIYQKKGRKLSNGLLFEGPHLNDTLSRT